MKLRPATLDDAALLLAWRNDPQTRLSSHHTDEVTWQEHIEWLTNVLRDPLRRLLIAEENGTAVGSLRADTDADGTSVLSWSVAPSARGRGVGTRMLHRALEEILGPVRAEIKKSNTASIRIAEYAGLRLTKEEAEVLHYAK